ncbi:hypothetical protein BH10ACT7_BH10ACT7_04770 [soil metagenome]
MVSSVLFVHAHPDDETISTGATIASLVDGGATVTVLTCTRGELGEVIPADLRHLAGTPALAAVREAELTAALAALGVADQRFLGDAGARWQGRPPRRYTDSGMRWGDHGAEPLQNLEQDSLAAAELGEVAADIAAVILETQPDLVISYAADGGYGHPDHIRAHEASRTAAEVLRVPFYVVEPGAKATVTVDPTPVVERKRAALAAHRTQVVVEGDSYSLSSGSPRPIAEPERFRRLRPSGSAFSDHSIVTRVVACALAFILGAFTGATLTVAHQASVAGVPWGIVAAVIITAALITGLRIIFETRIVAGCAAVGLLGASAFLALQSTGGSVLVPANPVGYTWTFAPVLITLVVLAWPRITARASNTMGVPAVKGPDHP